MSPISTVNDDVRVKKFIIAAVEYVTQWTVAQVLVYHTGNNIGSFVGKEIVTKLGAQKLLITDGGPELVVNTTKVYLNKHGINQSFITPYHLQANGRVESINGSLTQDLAELTANSPRAWAQHLQTVLMVCWVCINPCTGVSHKRPSSETAPY